MVSLKAKFHEGKTDGQNAKNEGGKKTLGNGVATWPNHKKHPRWLEVVHQHGRSARAHLKGRGKNAWVAIVHLAKSITRKRAETHLKS